MTEDVKLKNTNSKPIIIFPYRGYENNEKNEWYFWWTVDNCRAIDAKPIVMLPRDTVIRGEADSFINDERYKTLEVVQTWSVDTCQTWLAGWGHVLDNYPEAERIVQIPGDLDYVDDDIHFYENLKNFTENTSTDIIIGDFETGDDNNSKGLVDIYGSYPLLENWFVEILENLKELPLHRVRSEFLNIRTSVLREFLLSNRSFAYEQTLNFLIKSWNYNETQWKYDISVCPLGSLSDNKSFRDYRSCIDQIERTERMLSLLWREIKEPKRKDSSNEQQFQEEYALFSKKYDDLRLKSKGIMETARTTLRTFLGV